MICRTVSVLLFTSGSLLARTMGTVSFAVNIDGAGYQLSNSCLQSAIDASQIRDGPLNFWERVGLKNICIATELKNNF